MSSNFTACPLFVPTEAELNLKEGSDNKIIISCMIESILTVYFANFLKSFSLASLPAATREARNVWKDPHETFLLKEMAGESILTGRS